MAPKTIGKPGEKSPSSGQAVPVDNKGRVGGNEVTVVKDKPLPPTPKPGQHYVMVDPTKNKSGKG
ncbi:MAG: hypothetical protein J0L63_08815 [Anaerolineae bacterium]|nr:hypothetical protein [Anaerolineae bacterium]MBN8618995.1 hypothetical protein [Anaerolineae bacterium]